jgi:hypothetical protein
MHLSTIAKWLFVGERSRPLQPAVLAEIDQIDPGDPVQGFDEASELYVEPLDVDAQAASDAEAAQDLATLESELDERDADTDEPPPMPTPDGGDLYGVHVSRATDRELPDDDRTYEQGENWLEHMQATFSENGPEPERPVDATDESDDHGRHHATDTRDIPVADRGSAGPRGL